MTFRTSSNKINPALNLFKFSLKKNTGTSVIIGILALITCPIFGISFITSSRIFDMFNGSIDLSVYAMTSFVILSLLAILTALILTITNFNYLYSRQSGDMFYALPLSRTEMFFVRFLSIYTSSLFVTVLPYIGLSLMPLFGNIELDLAIVWKTFLVSAVMLFLTCAFFALFAVFSGGIFNFLVAGVTYCTTVITAGTFITTWLSQFTLGLDVFSTMFSGIWLNKIVRLIPCADYIVQLFRINPMFKGYPLYTVYPDATEQRLHFILVDVLIYLFAGIILMILALFLYRKRKAEKVGESYVFNFVKACVCICIAFVCATILGSIFSIFDEKQFSFLFWIFALLGALIGGTGTHAIISRGFKKFWKGLVSGILAFVFLFSAFTYTKIKSRADSEYVPPVERVAEATISVGNFSLKVGNKKDITEFHNLIVESIPDGEVYKLNDKTLVTAEKIEDGNMNNYNSFFSYEDNSFVRNFLPFKFSYTFDNGKKIERTYAVDYQWNSEAVQNLLFSDSVISQFEKADLEETVMLYCNSENAVPELPKNISSKNFIRLYKTLAEEFKTRKDDFDKKDIFFIEIHFGIYEDDKDSLENKSVRYASFPLMIPMEFENTLKLIDELRIEENEFEESFIKEIIEPLTVYAPNVEMSSVNSLKGKDLIPLFKAVCAIAKEDTEQWLNSESGKYEIPEDRITKLMLDYFGWDCLKIVQSSKEYNAEDKTLTIDTFEMKKNHRIELNYLENRNGFINADINYYVDGKFVIAKSYSISTNNIDTKNILIMEIH